MERRTPLNRTGRLRPRSSKVSETYRKERIPLVIALLEERPVCERCTSARSTDVHEIKSRARGGSITDIDNLAALCRPCHSWITTNPRLAHAEGWLKNSWE